MFSRSHPFKSYPALIPKPHLSINFALDKFKIKITQF